MICGTDVSGRGRHPGTHDDRGYVPASVPRRSALVPGDEEHGIGECGTADDPGHERLQERVPDGDRTAVHVVDQVGDDHLEVGGRRIEPGEPGDPCASRLVADDA